MKFASEDFFIEIRQRDHAYSMPKFHYHDSYEVYYIASGERTMLSNGRIYDLHAGDVALTRPNLLHKGAGNTAHKKMDTEFSKKFLDHYFTENMQKELLRCFKARVIHLNEEERKTFESLAYKLNKEYSVNGLYAVTLSEMLKFLSGIQERHENELHPEYRLQFKMSEKVRSILKYIQENFSDIRSVDEIASHVYLNKSYMCRLFKKETNMTIMGYLYNYRIQIACEKLIETELSVAEIAAFCGFENISHFIKLFRSMLDCTPGQFRRDNK
jgi:AraC-like DNA-binding protein